LTLFHIFPYAWRNRLALAPARLMQWTGVDRLLEKLGLLRLLPRSMRQMHDMLPRLKRHYGRLPELMPAEGTRRARVALFTGCVADALFQHVNWATARVLQANGCDVVIPRSQDCCGAIHYHSGAAQPALERARTNARAFGAADVDAVIINVAGCGAMLKDYGHIVHEIAPQNASLHEELSRFSAKVRDISEFLAELGPVSPSQAVPLRAVYHDACHLAHAQKIREQPRRLLAMVPGLELLPLPESDICCGAAGSYNLTETEMADRLGERKRSHILSSGAEAVICGNAGCTLQIQAQLKRAGRPLPVLHPVELLARAYGLEPAAAR
jgi:glycolate oxidase iron-sulfur subunit